MPLVFRAKKLCIHLYFDNSMTSSTNLYSTGTCICIQNTQIALSEDNKYCAQG